MKLFLKLIKQVEKNESNRNFHINQLSWIMRVWFKALCDLIEKQPTVKFEKMYSDVEIPEYQTDGSAGMDLRAIGFGTIYKDEIKIFGTGLKIQIPKGYEGQIRPRSGVAIKHGITVINSPGTIDSDYRGEIKIGLINKGTNSYNILKNDRIAQLVIKKVSKPSIQIVNKLDKTKRGENGFGSTGCK